MTFIGFEIIFITAHLRATRDNVKRSARADDDDNDFPIIFSLVLGHNDMPTTAVVPSCNGETSLINDKIHVVASETSKEFRSLFKLKVEVVRLLTFQSCVLGFNMKMSCVYTV